MGGDLIYAGNLVRLVDPISAGNLDVEGGGGG